MSNTALAQQQTDFQILSAVISSDRNVVGIDIAKVISDFVIYEHIEKAYLTARFLFIDQENTVRNTDHNDQRWNQCRENGNLIF